MVNLVLIVTTALLFLNLPDTLGFPLTKNIEDFKFLVENSKPLSELDCKGWNPSRRRKRKM